MSAFKRIAMLLFSSIILLGIGVYFGTILYSPINLSGAPLLFVFTRAFVLGFATCFFVLGGAVFLILAIEIIKDELL